MCVTSLNHRLCYLIYKVTCCVRASVRWRSAAEPVCPSNDVPWQNRPVRSTTFCGRTDLEIRGPVLRVSGPRLTDGHGFFFKNFFSLSRSCPSGFRTSTDRRTRVFFFFFFFFRPFPTGCPGLIPGFFFSRPLQEGCPGLIPRLFIYFPPFSCGLPRVNTRVFFFCPFQASCPGLIPGFFIYFYLFPALFRRAVVVDPADENGSQNREKKIKRGY
jgi:hypothetical protein